MENYQPQPGMAPPPPDRNVILGMVNGPAIAIMVVGGLGILMGMISLLINILSAAGSGMSSMMGGYGPSGMMSMMSGGVGIISALFGIALNGAAVFGAMKMKNLENYGFAIAAAVMVMLPCTCCCMLGLGAGIWAIVILMKPEVKAAFRG